MSRISLLDEFTDKNLDKLTQSDIANLQAKLEKKRKPKLTKGERAELEKLVKTINFDQIVVQDKTVLSNKIYINTSIEWDNKGKLRFESYLTDDSQQIPLAHLPKAAARVETIKKNIERFDKKVKQLAKKYNVSEQVIKSLPCAKLH